MWEKSKFQDDRDELHNPIIHCIKEDIFPKLTIDYPWPGSNTGLPSSVLIVMHQGIPKYTTHDIYHLIYLSLYMYGF
jgi:hypothetical protein